MTRRKKEVPKVEVLHPERTPARRTDINKSQVASEFVAIVPKLYETYADIKKVEASTRVEIAKIEAKRDIANTQCREQSKRTLQKTQSVGDALVKAIEVGDHAARDRLLTMMEA